MFEAHPIVVRDHVLPNMAGRNGFLLSVTPKFVFITIEMAAANTAASALLPGRIAPRVVSGAETAVPVETAVQEQSLLAELCVVCCP